MVEPQRIEVNKTHFGDPIGAVLRLALRTAWTIPKFVDFRFDEVPHAKREALLNRITPDNDDLDRLECELRCARIGHPQPVVLTHI